MTKVLNATEDKANSLIYKVKCKDIDGNNMYINIRLNDECKNGKQDFAITASIYEKGKQKVDKYFICGGCCHDEILKVKPELKIFVNLHLCDHEGIPMYAVENGFYHLKNGFNNTSAESQEFKAKFCEYYRITGQQFDSLKTAKNILQYSLKLKSLNILEQWKKEADEAIKLLEKMTGKTFLVDRN